jgi:hypothetical protein
MKMAKTFLDAAWDFVVETVNGTDDIWWILEGKDYPRLWWQYLAFLPYPSNGATDVIQPLGLRWVPPGAHLWHEIYFGDDGTAVADATRQTQGIYRGRQPPEMTTYEPGILQWRTTYYWRIDEVNDADPNNRWKGSVWSFTTSDCVKSPDPADGAIDVIQPTILSWVPGGPRLQYDVYLGEDKNAVASATPESVGIYQGRQPYKMTTYEPGRLKFTTTYYWRIDGVEEADPNTRWKGKVRSFTTADYIITSVVDDFESYTDDIGGRIFQTWLDGWGWDKPEPNYPGNGTGSCVGSASPPFAEQAIKHGGRQSMPMDYDNDGTIGKGNTGIKFYSEAERNWETPQDWTVDSTDTLTVYFLGDPKNNPEPLYIGVEDSSGQIAAVVHPDADAVLATEWQKWHIPLAGVRAMGVDVAAVKKMVIGVGDPKNPQPGGTGRIYIDDILLTRRFLLIDFDGDMDTDFLDFCIFAEHWLQSDSSFYCGAGGTDLTNDGFVDFDDLEELAENWLTGTP